MRKALYWIGGIGALLFAALLIVPFLIPTERYKQEVIARVRALTGRDLQINGAVHLSVFPTLQITVEDAALSNPKGFSSPQMLSVHQLSAELALAPLLHKEVRIQRFVLRNPTINLEVNETGLPNWTFDPAPVAETQEMSGWFIASAQAASSALSSLRLGEVHAYKGTVNYRDARKKMNETVSDLDLNMSMATFSDPMTVDSRMTWRGKLVTVTASLNTLDKLLQDQPATVQWKLKTDFAQADFDGRATLQNAEGQISASTPSIPQLVSWVGTAFQWPQNKPPLAFSMKGQVACTKTHCRVSQGEYSLDRIAAKGDIGLVFQGIPEIAAMLTLGEVDVTPYLDQAAQAQRMPSIISAVYAAPATTPQWSTTPFNLSALRSFHMRSTFELAGIKLRQFTLGKTQANLRLHEGVLQADIPQAALYGGAAKASLTLNAQSTPSFHYNVGAQQIQVEPLLKDAASFDRFTGTAALDARGTAEGESVNALIHNLNGNGAVQLTDGAIRGIDLAQITQNISSLISLQNISGNPQTAFTQASGTYTITQGVLTNKDLLLTAPLLHLTGAGTVSLRDRTLSYRFEPQIAAAKAQEGRPRKTLGVPVRVEGPWDNLVVQPEITAQNVQENIDAAKEQFKSLKGDVKSLKKELKENPDTINNLLKNLGR